MQDIAEGCATLPDQFKSASQSVLAAERENDSSLKELFEKQL